SLAKSRDGEAKAWRLRRRRRAGQTAGGIVVHRGAAVHDGKSCAKYRLWVDLICNSQPRRGSVRIIMGDAAIASAGSAPIVDRRAEKSTGRRIRRRRTEVRSASVLLSQVR